MEDYVEELMPGMKEALDKVRDCEDEIEELTFENDEWEQKEMLWRFLRKYTEGDAKKVVASVHERNGCTAWRKLRQQYEPGLVMRERRW